MINPRQLRDLIIKPTLDLILPDTTGAATELLLGTAMQESKCGEYIAQLGGPALGVWQMEPATFADLTVWLSTKPKLKDNVRSLWLPDYSGEAVQMPGNLYLSCAMARLLYYRIPEALPKQGDFAGQARYYKKYYNTPAGAATVTQYIQNWHILKAQL